MIRLYGIAHNLPAEPKRFVKFLFVGSFGFVVDFGVFNLVHSLYSMPNTSSDEISAQAISFSCAVLSNFVWNYFWIYPDSRTASLWKKIAKFAAVSVIGLIIRTPVFSLALPVAEHLVTSLGVGEALPFNLPGNLALATAVCVVLLWNFFVNRYWTYSDVN